MIYESNVMKINNLKKEQPLPKGIDKDIKRKHTNRKRKRNRELKSVMQKLR